MELTVNISANNNGSSDRLDVGLLHKNFLGLLAELLHLSLWQWLALKKLCNLTIEVTVVEAALTN